MMKEDKLNNASLLPDLQNSDKESYYISKVGIKDIKYPICLNDGDNGSYQTIGVFDICSDLKSKQRGTHMSRLVEILDKYHSQLSYSIIIQLLQEICDRLNCTSAFIKIAFPIFIAKKAPVSQLEAYVSYDCLIDATLNKGKFSINSEVNIPVKSLCPCSKAISSYGAHNQRAMINIRMENYDNFAFSKIIKLAESSGSSEIYSLLKRVDEKFVTEKAYDNPMFVEDIVRDLIGKLSSISYLKILSVAVNSMESIHNHNAFAFISNE